MKKIFGYNITFISLLLCIFATQVSAAEETDTEGYDENTEITIKGTINDVFLPVRGPVILIVQYKNRPLRIITAPKWFLVRNRIEFSSGMNVEITGSKFFARNGNFYLSARKIVLLREKRLIELRDGFCRPMWRMTH